MLCTCGVCNILVLVPITAGCTHVIALLLKKRKNDASILF